MINYMHTDITDFFREEGIGWLLHRGMKNGMKNIWKTSE